MLLVPCWQEGNSQCPVLRLMTDLLLEFATQLQQVSVQTLSVLFIDSSSSSSSTDVMRSRLICCDLRSMVERAGVWGSCPKPHRRALWAHRTPPPAHATYRYARGRARTGNDTFAQHATCTGQGTLCISWSGLLTHDTTHRMLHGITVASYTYAGR